MTVFELRNFFPDKQQMNAEKELLPTNRSSFGDDNEHQSKAPSFCKLSQSFKENFDGNFDTVFDPALNFQAENTTRALGTPQKASNLELPVNGGLFDRKNNTHESKLNHHLPA